MHIFRTMYHYFLIEGTVFFGYNMWQTEQANAAAAASGFDGMTRQVYSFRDSVRAYASSVEAAHGSSTHFSLCYSIRYKVHFLLLSA